MEMWFLCSDAFSVYSLYQNVYDVKNRSVHELSSLKNIAAVQWRLAINNVWNTFGHKIRWKWPQRNSTIVAIAPTYAHTYTSLALQYILMNIVNM